ncbi:meiotic recombination protein REC8 homolog [Cyprinodon tularosa]|uniref:meiotic recombination protein REC8 homolog n=1 Tax=Cyprinodon tularosa TaxID=77115 RepID=UPI0018E1F0B0|nr:meiotic recombination protein REC8 homolog [Cyprinodon tularosa]
MFYHPVVLNRRSGCFSTIWLVATKGIKVPRRDLLRVDVTRTCNDIMNYVLGLVNPPQPGLPRPRFSLYLSSQLQYGVILVYHRQCAIFLDELQFMKDRLLKQWSITKIDLEDHSRQRVDLPDPLSVMEDTEGAPDPLFGEMLLHNVVPSPSSLIQMSKEYLRGASPELPLGSSSASLSPDVQTGITASPESITLREAEPVPAPAAEFEGEDFAGHLAQTINMLLDQPDDFPGSLELPEEEMRGQEKEQTKEMTGSTAELQPTTVSSEGPELLAPEQQGPPKDQLTPVSASRPPSPPSAAEGPLRSPELEEAQIEVRRKKRRRQLVFFDAETQLSEEELQRQIDDPLTETTSPPLHLLPSHRVVPPAELLNNPCSFLPKEIEALWRQAATITELLDTDLQVGETGPESTDSEKEREREMMEVAEREEQRLRETSTEVQEAMMKSDMLGTSADDALPLEVSDQREKSREISPLHTSEREGSSISTALPDIQEAEEEMTEMSLLPELLEHAEEPILFHSLLPPGVNRTGVSNLFHSLLENVSSRRIRAEQEEPYGAILIYAGSSYEETNLPL